MKQSLFFSMVVVLVGISSTATAQVSSWRSILVDGFSFTTALVANFCQADMSNVIRLTPAQKRYYCQKSPSIRTLYDRCNVGYASKMQIARQLKGSLKYFYRCPTHPQPVELIFPEAMRKDLEQDWNRPKSGY